MTAAVHLDALLREIASLRDRLAETEAALVAISKGEVDAFVVGEDHGAEVITASTVDGFYRTVVDRICQGAVTIGMDGVILYANDCFREMLASRSAANGTNGHATGGQKREGNAKATSQPIGQSLRELVVQADLPLLEAAINFSAPPPRPVALRLKRRDGSSLPALLTTVMMAQEAGACVIVTDLTEQKRHEALVAAENLSRSILDQVLDAIVVCDTQGNVIRASQAALRMCLGNPMLQKFSESFPLQCQDGGISVNEVLKGQRIEGMECSLVTQDGQMVHVLLSAGAVTNSTGKVLGCIISMTDISGRKRAESQMREADRRKDEFLAVLAHELRNPLAPIRNGVQILTRCVGTQETAKMAVSMIDRQVNNLVRLVDDLLDVNRINQGRVSLRKEPVLLNTIVEQAVETCRPLVDQRRHRVELDWPATQIWVNGDSVRLTQVVLNLLNNAAKFSPEGGRIRIHASVEQDDGQGPHAVLRIRDWGFGIAAEKIAQIFEPFMQINPSNHQSAGGLGLGLTLARRLCEMHDGTLAAYSEGEGHGSEFIMRLPMRKAEPAAEPVMPVADAAPVKVRRRILVVDDNIDAAESMALLLQAAGHVVEITTDAGRAVAHATRLMPDAVILDIGMPGVSGYEVAWRMRQIPALANLRILAITGYGTERDRARSRESGIDVHLVKPLSVQVLEKLVADPCAEGLGEDTGATPLRNPNFGAGDPGMGSAAH